MVVVFQDERLTIEGKDGVVVGKARHAPRGKVNGEGRTYQTVAPFVAQHQVALCHGEVSGRLADAQEWPMIGTRCGVGEVGSVDLQQVELHAPIDTPRGHLCIVYAHQLPLPIEQTIARVLIFTSAQEEQQTKPRKKA